MGLKEIGWEVEDWIHVVQDRNQVRDLVSMAINLRVL
jgi:hypothetical protein